MIIASMKKKTAITRMKPHEMNTTEKRCVCGNQDQESR
jgi:hypothetical protein